MFREIFQRLERLAREGRVSSEEMRRFSEQEILIEGSFKFVRGY